MLSIQILFLSSYAFTLRFFITFSYSSFYSILRESKKILIEVVTIDVLRKISKVAGTYFSEKYECLRKRRVYMIGINFQFKRIGVSVFALLYFHVCNKQ